MTLWSTILQPFRAGPRRPLAMRQPARHDANAAAKPLGMEATDLEHVHRIARQNDALERSNTTEHGPNGTSSAAEATYIRPMADDETYAARFYNAFKKKGPNT